MLRLPLRFLSVCLLVLGSACSDDEADSDRQIDSSTPLERDSGMDARSPGDPDAGRDANVQWLGETPMLPSCPRGGADCPRFGAGVWKVLLEASRFGVDAQFESLGGGTVVVHGGSAAAWQVARLARSFMSEAERVEVWNAPANTAALIDALDAQYSDDFVLALGCPEDDSGCSLLRGKSGSSELVALEGGSVPSTIKDVRGLVWDELGARVCVFGSGLLCFKDGAWMTLIEPNADVLFRDVQLEGGLGIAVGASGALWTSRRTEDPNSAWLPLWRDGRDDLDEVNAYGDEALIRAGTRLWSWSKGSDQQCVEGGSFVAAWVHVNGLLLALADSGRLLSYESFGGAPVWCTAQQLGPLDVIESGTAPCGIALNQRVLTRSTLVGTNLCALD
jgi:hypothetical protein